MMGWNLPPGCSDRDIDEAAQGELVQCDCCLRMFPSDEMTFIRHDHPTTITRLADRIAKVKTA